MKMLTDRMVFEGQALPFWYGVTYRDPAWRAWVCHPIPLNFLVRWGRALWWFLAREPKADRLESACEAAYERGFRVGQKHGEVLGYNLHGQDLNELKSWRMLADNWRDLAAEGETLIQPLVDAADRIQGAKS